MIFGSNMEIRWSKNKLHISKQIILQPEEKIDHNH